MIILSVGNSVKVTPLDTTIFKSKEPIIGKVLKINHFKTEMIVVGYQGGKLEGRLIKLNQKNFNIEKTRIPKQLSERIEIYTKINFVRLPIKDIALSNNIYRKVETKSFDDVTVFNVKEFGPDTLVYRYYEYPNPYKPVLKAVRVKLENGEVVSEGERNFKNFNLTVAKQIHEELKLGKEDKVYVIANKGEFIYSTDNKEDLYWDLYKLLLNKDMINILDLEIFTNKI